MKQEMKDISTYINEAFVTIEEAKVKELSASDASPILKKLKIAFTEHDDKIYLRSIEDAQEVSDELAGKYDVVFDDNEEKFGNKKGYRLVIFK